jgi:glycosyltransferase involved in cell wall biosynthesis
MANISVIMPAFNSAKTIEKSILSVLTQTYNNWELTIVDDGSTDLTFEIIERYRDPRISNIKQANLGVAIARMAGCQRSNSKYLIFIDSDDWWDIRCLEVLIETLEHNDNITIAHGDWVYVNEHGSLGPVESSFFNYGSGLLTLIRKNPLAIHSALIRRDSFEQIGGFNLKYNTLEDWELWLRFASKGYKFQHVPYVVAYYFWHSNSKSKNAQTRKEQRLNVLDNFWSEGNLPTDLFALKDQSYATAYIDFYISDIAMRDLDTAFLDLEKLLTVDPASVFNFETYYRIFFTKYIAAELNNSIEFYTIEYIHTLKEIVFAHIDLIFTNESSNKYRDKAKGNACWALGKGFYDHRFFKEARHWFFYSAKYELNFLTKMNYWFLIIKSFFPPSIIDILRRWKLEKISS